MAEPPTLGTRTVALVLSMGFLAILSWATFADNVPSAISPFSLAVVIPVFEGGAAFAMMLMPFFFFLWSVNLIDGRTTLPLRSVVLFGLVTVGVGYWFVTGWSYGLQYQGPALVMFWAAVNAALVPSL